MKMLFQYVSLALMVSMFSGCASLTKEDYQRVQFETYSKDNKLIVNAKCRARNERGDWIAFSTGTLTEHRSAHNLLVTCEKEGEATGHATLISRVNDAMVGNVFYGVAGGFGVGAILDDYNGNGYSYPDWVRIVMGDNLVFDRRANKRGHVMIGTQPVEPAVTTDQKTFVDNLLFLLP